MNHKHSLLVLAAGLFLAVGLSPVALADPGSGERVYRSHKAAGHAAHAGKSRFRPASHHRGYKRSYKRGHKRSLHASRGHYRSPARHYRRAHHAPRSYGHYRYARHHRYHRYHRDVNVGAVVAGLVVGGIIYEILRDGRDDEDAYYVDH